LNEWEQLAMHKSQLIAIYDQDQRKDVEFPEARREITSNVVRHIDISGNREGIITYSKLNETNVEDVIREQVSYFERIGQDFEWKLYDYDGPPDLKERLAAHGFSVEEEEAIMVLNLAWKDRFGTKIFRRWAISWERRSAVTQSR
jgi:hypothetical protein